MADYPPRLVYDANDPLQTLARRGDRVEFPSWLFRQLGDL